MALVPHFSEQQYFMFTGEMNLRRKNSSTALALCLFLGGLGAHHFYLRNTALGVIYVLFVWTFIPVFLSFLELFVINGRVDKYNRNVAFEVAGRLLYGKMMPMGQFVRQS